MIDSNIAMLQLWRLISPALPVGAYAYSQGLEYAIECDWVNDQGSCYEWIDGILVNNISYLDLPVIKRFHAAWLDNDLESVQYWAAYLAASRETKELLLEDQQIGDSLARLLTDLKIKKACHWQQHRLCSYPLMFSLAGAHWNIPIKDLLLGYAWTWCENQIAAAMKLIPLGQTHGQQLLGRLLETINQATQTALHLNDEEIGRTCPGQVMASALHEQQYSRLFRS